MPHRLTERALRATLLSFAVAGTLAAQLPTVAHAQRAAIQFSGPSVVRSEPAEFAGSGFAANQPVSIAVKAPGGEEAIFSAVADASGKFSVRVSPAGKGTHVIRVLSTRGGELARISMVAMP